MTYPLHTILYSIVQPWELLLGTYVFLIIIAGILVFNLLYLLKRFKKSSYREALRKEFLNLIGAVAISENAEELRELVNSPSVKDELGHFLSTSYSRHILTKELVTGAKNMNGVAYKNICWLYAELGLQDDTLIRLKSKEWHVKAKAIQTLAHLGQKQHVTRIYRFTNSKNELVRHEARIAVVKLTGFEGLRFLDVISYPLTEWQQLHLVHELSKDNSTSFKGMHRWLHSKNDSVVEFALRLVEIYRIYDLHDEVVALLAHPQEAVRLKAINTLCEIQNDQTARKIVVSAEGAPTKVQFAILKAMQKTGTENEIPFLVHYLSHQENDFKIAAARAIRKIRTNYLDIIEHAVNKSDQPWPILLSQLKKEAAA